MGRCTALGRIPQTLRQGVFRFALKIALPNAAVAAGLKALDQYLPNGNNGFLAGVLSPNAFSSFTFLIGLFIAFRTSQAYGRFWDGSGFAFQIMDCCFQVASSTCAFCRLPTEEKSTADKADVDNAAVKKYKHTLVRLFSLFHALILAELEAVGKIQGTEDALDLEVLDLSGLDAQTLHLLRESDLKVDLVMHWIQLLLVQGLHSGILNIAPPILTRAFQELNTCMHYYHEALRITEVPIPFPYTAATEVMLIIHWCLTPVVTGTWTEYILGSAIFSLVQVFMVWSLNCLTEELENPFGNDENDLERYKLHMLLNMKLAMLVEDAAVHVPRLSESVSQDARTFYLKEIYSTSDLQERASRKRGSVAHRLTRGLPPALGRGGDAGQAAKAAGAEARGPAQRASTPDQAVVVGRPETPEKRQLMETE